MNNIKIISDQCRLIGFLIGTIEGIRWNIPDGADFEKIDSIIDKVKKEANEIMERISYES
jgi:hypothetical protein